MIISSDNPSNYSSVSLQLLLPLVAASNGIAIYKYINTETQDEKSSLDAFFAVATWWVHKYCKKTYKNVNELFSLVDTIEYNGGVTNYCAFSILYHKEISKPLVDSVAKLSKDIKKYGNWLNKVEFSFVEEKYNK